MKKVICPDCNLEAQKGYYADTFGCNCTGLFKEISTNQNGGRVPNYDPSTRIVFNKKQPLSTNSYYLDHKFKNLLVKGEILSLCDSSKNTEASFIFINNVLKKVSNALIIDVSNKFRKFYKNIGGQNTNIKFMKPKSLDEAYEKIINEIDNYDYIAFLNANLLVTQMDIDNQVSQVRIEMFHRNYLSKIRTIMNKKSCSLTITSSLVKVNRIASKIDDRLSVLNQVSDIMLKLNKSKNDNRIVFFNTFDNHSPNKKTIGKEYIELDKLFSYDRECDLIQLMIELKMIKKIPRSINYEYILDQDLTLSDGSIIKTNELITKKMFQICYNSFLKKSKTLSQFI